ncbi:MAG: hypothetical protein IJZ69_00445 [Bacteroidales bacterium]|nr:hypothetical protein [Bacteroidales bacterium]
METIIGLLFILLPVIFKFIGKRLEQSGQSDKAGKFKKIAEKLNGDEEVETPVFDWLSDEPDEGPEMPFEEPVKPAPVVIPVPAEPQIHLWEAEAQPVSKKKIKHAQKSVKARKPMLEEEVPQKKREKIDPKKLVIYSEIMKPKY